MSEAVEVTELLEIIGGRRCPCGHLGSKHHIPTPAESRRWPGLIEVLGTCHECACRGLVELDGDDDA